MTLTRRVIACLDVTRGRVVKGVGFVDLRDVGDPVELAERYERDGADEIVFLDISASADARDTLLDLAERTAARLFIPLTIGGGVRTADDVGRALRAGADKVSINSAAVERPAILTESADRFGSQCVVASIDAKRSGDGRWQVYVRGGRQPTGLDALEWATECVERGAGEILLTSIDRDGARSGYDIELTSMVSSTVTVPVIASGGAGAPRDVVDVLAASCADAALVAGILHDGVTSLLDIKRALTDAGVAVRSGES
ncbi:MAG: imidazole glycerol phosphate synthase subunit HisF [Gemmatimonas sp.]|nr:imidazole glycerol phosphate synthase subunit HisF [Gemmatimonadaceae bacterium]